MSQEKKLDRNKILYIALICLFSLVFLGSAIYLIVYFVNSAKQSQQYDDLASIVESIRQDMAADPDSTDPDYTGATGSTDAVGSGSLILPEYQALYEMNSELVGWINIPGTRVNYPVCQSLTTKDFYLTHNFNKEEAGDGCIYVREVCDVFTPSDNVVIYGHRMNSGSMFADLMNYRKKDFWESHQTFTFDTIYEHHSYQVIAVFITTANYGEGFAYHQFNDAANQAEFDAFMKTVHELQLYDTGHTAQYGDMLITLSTCTPRYEQPSNGRLVVIAKRIS
jgi:sortase B